MTNRSPVPMPFPSVPRNAAQDRSPVPLPIGNGDGNGPQHRPQHINRSQEGDPQMTDHYTEAQSNLDEAETMAEQGAENAASSYALIALTHAVLALVDTTDDGRMAKFDREMAEQARRGAARRDAIIAANTPGGAA